MSETDVLLIGAGQCGLALSRELTRRGVSHEVLSERAAPGDVWRERWDSLRLFTPARFDGLPGRPFPASARHRPTGRAFGDYLDDYAEWISAPVHPRQRATRIVADDHGFVVTSRDDAQGWRARRVVVATGGQTRPRVPARAAALDARIVQRHTSEYRRPEDLPGERVLVVGCGTSGVQLGIELARAGRRVVVAGRPTARIPAPLLAVAGPAWFTFMHRVLTHATPIGRRAAVRAVTAGAPLVGISPRDLARAGARLAPRFVDVVDGLPRLADGTVVETDAVLWATGYRPDLDWIDGLPLDEHGMPAHDRGVSTDIAGLAFMGLPFQFGLTSTLIGGSGRDAEHLAAVIQTSSRLLAA
ncbi:NAD(P)/FAD-dependent oxidoreductase [Microbacterium sp. KUDC0406]|uniref:flavin-containing monooxygenase n=1 Tax=Microbacterium sp. KUDC0406 TaxID=2909588 RepID=UPI001F41076F|nr:NAD(P)/FAD-dependent oxidoreductase [Microbacterium sp. KUDC0406]UJP09052.1 NAD(P)/FAD-dependent oxidoreductase [Microbacterium sp. KUDC0406]